MLRLVGGSFSATGKIWWIQAGIWEPCDVLIAASSVREETSARQRGPRAEKCDRDAGVAIQGVLARPGDPGGAGPIQRVLLEMQVTRDKRGEAER